MGVQAGRRLAREVRLRAQHQRDESEIETGDGRFDLYDFAPRIMQGMRVDAPIEICRLLLPMAGTPRVRVLFDPKPDYARANFEIAAAGQGVEVVGGPTRLYLSSNVLRRTDGRIADQDRSADFLLR